MKKTAGIRLRNLKRRSGFDANILPAKRPALSDANRQAKVNNIEMVLTMINFVVVVVVVVDVVDTRVMVSDQQGDVVFVAEVVLLTAQSLFELALHY